MKNRIFAGLLALSMVMAVSAPVFADGVINLKPLSAQDAYGNGFQDDGIALRGRVSTIPRGTNLLVQLDQPVSSYTTNLGESVTGTLENDIFINDAVVIPAGSEVVGQVTNVSRSSRLGKHGEIDVRFNSVKTPGGMLIPIEGKVVTEDESGVLRGNTYKMDIAKGLGIAAGVTGIGAVAGTALGAIIGPANAGAAFGTAVGGLAGITYAVMRKGKDVVLPRGSRMTLTVDRDTSINF